MDYKGNKKSKYLISDKESDNISTLITDEIFVWGIILAPMTALRLYKFGPGEILLIVWMILVFWGNNPSTIYNSGTLPITIIGKYQIANIIMMAIGMFVNLLVYKGQFETGTIITTFFTHSFMFLISSCIFLYFDERELEAIHSIIRKILFRGAVIYGILLAYALFINTHLFGISLWLGNQGYRFLGLALNPHQISMITGVGVFFSLYMSSTEKKVNMKLLYLILCFLWYVISLSLRSDTLTLTYIGILFITIFLKLLKGTKNIDVRRKNIFVITGITLVCILIFFPLLWRKLYGFVSEAGNGLGRLDLWASGMGQFIEKPICLITGLGPGGNTGQFMSVSGNEIEAHNTYIQQILNSGVFIFLYYIFMIYEILKKPLEKSTYLVVTVMYFVLYGFGGNMNRRVLMWFTYTIVMVLFEKTNNTEISTK